MAGDHLVKPGPPGLLVNLSEALGWHLQAGPQKNLSRGTPGQGHVRGPRGREIMAANMALRASWAEEGAALQVSGS